jgi:hypothetical protein
VLLQSSKIHLDSLDNRRKLEGWNNRREFRDHCHISRVGNSISNGVTNSLGKWDLRLGHGKHICRVECAQNKLHSEGNYGEREEFSGKVK